MSGRAGLGLMSLALKVEKGGVSGRPLGGKENRGTDAYQEPLGDTALTTPQSQPTEAARQLCLTQSWKVTDPAVGGPRSVTVLTAATEDEHRAPRMCGVN